MHCQICRRSAGYPLHMLLCVLTAYWQSEVLPACFSSSLLGGRVSWLARGAALLLCRHEQAAAERQFQEQQAAQAGISRQAQRNCACLGQQLDLALQVSPRQPGKRNLTTTPHLTLLRPNLLSLLFLPRQSLFLCGGLLTALSLAVAQVEFALCRAASPAALCGCRPGHGSRPGPGPSAGGKQRPLWRRRPGRRPWGQLPGGEKSWEPAQIWPPVSGLFSPGFEGRLHGEGVVLMSRTFVR